MLALILQFFTFQENSGFIISLNFLDRFSKKQSILHFIKIHPIGAELFYADGQTDMHEEANSRFSQFRKLT